MEYPELPRALQDLPKPMVAGLFIFVGIVVIMILKPQHSVCESQMETIQASQAGALFPQKVGKRTTPGRIQSALEMCRFGNSGGSCYEYFDLLRKAAIAVKNGASQCTSDLLSISIDKYSKMETYGQVRDGAKMRDELASVSYRSANLGQVFADGLEMMVEKAWGEAPPDPAQRFGWFRETELGTFCHLRDLLIRTKGREGFLKFAHEIYAKLPGEAAPAATGGGPRAFVARRATQVFSDREIQERSLISTPCDSYR